MFCGNAHELTMQQKTGSCKKDWTHPTNWDSGNVTWHVKGYDGNYTLSKLTLLQKLTWWKANCPQTCQTSFLQNKLDTPHQSIGAEVMLHVMQILWCNHFAIKTNISWEKHACKPRRCASQNCANTPQKILKRESITWNCELSSKCWKVALQSYCRFVHFHQSQS